MRHTTPNVSTQICYGKTDIALAATFESEAAAAYKALPSIDAIVTSPLSRCRRLADYISAQTRVQISIDDRFQEMDFGNWEMTPWSDVPRDELDIWADNFLHAKPHGGESVDQLRQRVRQGIFELQHENSHILIITHSGVIRAAFSTGDTIADFDTRIDFGMSTSLIQTSAANR